MAHVTLRRTATGMLLTSALFVTGAAAPPPPSPSPVLEGDAFVRSEGADDYAPTKAGASLAPGCNVRTAPGVVSTMKIAQGVSVRMAPSTTFGLRSTSWLPAEHPGASAVRAVQLQLSEGELDLEVHDPANGLGILVMLPGGRSVALWRGAGNVAVHGDDVAVALYEGMGIAGSASKWRPLTPHTGVVLGAKTVSATKPTPGTPAWIDGLATATAPFAIVRGDERAVVGGSWDAVPEAATYRVEMGPEAHLAGPLEISKTDSTSMKTDPIAAGSYFVRVRAISADGIEGPPSTVKALRVARLSLPPLAFAGAGGAVVLGETQALKLDDPRDIEIATQSEYDPNAPPRWVPATSELTLGEDAKRTVLIRHAISHVQSKVVLVRRELHARIAFNPPHPQWPGTPVEILVHVEDPSGYLDASRETLTFDVRVDLTKLNLSWEHNGSVWSAKVPPQSPPGPWVVRVGVEDRTGVAVGAALLDVDATTPGSKVQRAKYEGSQLQVQR